MKIPIVGDFWWLGVLLASCGANATAQVLWLRISPSFGLYRSLFAGFLCGLAVGLLSSLYFFDRPLEQHLVDLCIYLCFEYSYFNFNNMGETARRVRLLLELRDAPAGLAQGEWLARYGAREMVDRRLGRLLATGQIIEQGAGFVLGNRSGLAVAWIVDLFRRILMGTEAFVGGREQGPSPTDRATTRSWRLIAASLRPRELRAALTSDLGLACAIFAAVLPLYLLSDKINVSGGFGWDGAFYGELSKRFPQVVFVQGLDTYQVQRILPSAIVHFALLGLSVQPTNRNIILGFIVLDALALAGLAYSWCRVARHLQVSSRGKWLGFIGLFVNFAVLKQTGYYPVLTDSLAYLEGMLMLHFSLTARRVPLAAVTVLSSFTWPSSLYVGAALLLFCGPTRAAVEGVRRAWRYFPPFVALLFAAGWYVYTERLVALGSDSDYGAVPLMPVLSLSIACLLGYLYFALYYLLKDSPLVQGARAVLPGWRNLAVAALTAAVVVSLQLLLTGGRPPPIQSEIGLLGSIPGVALSAIFQPGVFYVAHLVYFGPVVALVALTWPRTCQLVQSHGLGVMAIVALAVVLGLGSESRRAINLWPFIVPFVVKATDALDWPRSNYWLIATLAALWSKVWLTIGPIDVGLAYRDFPNQLYFMNYGPYMSHVMYVAQGACALLTTAWLYKLCSTGGSVRSEERASK